MLIFEEIKLSDKHRIETCMEESHIFSCQYSFANLFSLKEKYGTEICIEDNALFIRQTRRTKDRKIAYFFPVCRDNIQEKISKIVETGEQQGHGFYFFCVFEEDIEKFGSLNINNYVVEKSTDWAEYMYDSSRIFHLTDGNLSKIRRGVNQFWELYGEFVEVERINSDNINDIVTFQSEWYQDNISKTDNPDALMEENRAIRTGLTYFEMLDLEGIIIKIDGKVEAYCYGCVVGQVVFDVIAQKANKEYRHIYKVLFQELLRSYWENIKWTNMEEDIGLLGLRQLKNSYRPDYHLLKYTVIPKN